MKSKYILIILLLGFIVYAGFGLTGSQKSDGDFKEVLTKAKLENKKVIIDFYTDWCGWCKKMDADTYANENVKSEMNKNFVFIKLNAESSDKLEYDGKTYSKAQLSKAFGVTGFPATVFLESDSSPITVVPGYLDSKTFINILRFLSQDIHKTKKSFDDFVKEQGAN